MLSGRHDVVMTRVVNINDVLDGHVGLDLACIDRLFLTSSVPNLQVSGQMVIFLTAHLGFQIPSLTLLQKIGNRFRNDLKRFAASHDIPILQLNKPARTRLDDRKIDHVRPTSIGPTPRVRRRRHRLGRGVRLGLQREEPCVDAWGREL